MKKLTKTTLISLATLTVLSIGALATCDADVDMGGHKITTTATEFSDNELISKAYVKELISTALEAAIQTERFSRNDNTFIVTDHTTGLMWQDNEDVKTIKKQWLTDDKYANCQDAMERKEELNRCEETSGDTAATYCENLSLGDYYSGWRLPTYDELSGITESDHRTINSIFKNITTHAYWSSNTILGYEDDAKIFFFNYMSRDGSNKNYFNYVRCVRKRTW